jgi:hypothetical protein
LSWHRPLPEERQLALLWAVAAVSSVVLKPLWLALVPRLRPCLFHALTGVPCPTCGTTRAALAVLDLRVADAFAINPLATAVGLVFAVGGPVAALWTLLGLPVPDLPSTRLPRWLIWVILGLGLVNWLYLILTL